jgi:hypothetical protein
LLKHPCKMANHSCTESKDLLIDDFVNSNWRLSYPNDASKEEKICDVSFSTVNSSASLPIEQLLNLNPKLLNEEDIPEFVYSASTDGCSFDDDSISLVDHQDIKPLGLRSCDSRLKRKVSFGEVEIRPYFTTLGDNPGSSWGAPIMLSWDFDTDAVSRLYVDEYEKQRGPLRSGRDLFLSRNIREAILTDCGFSLQDIIVASNRATLDRRRRMETVMNLRYSPVHEVVERVRRRLKRIRARLPRLRTN